MSHNASDSASPTAAVLPFTPPRKLRWLWLTLGLTGIALVSAGAGALLAVSMTSTPLAQRKLSATEAKAFNQGDIAAGHTLQLPQLTRPVNIIVLGAKVLTSDMNDPPSDLTGLSYDPVVNSLEGLTDSMLLVRFSPETHQLVVLSLPRDTRTLVEGEGVTKLNEANAVGGPALAAKSTSELLGGVGIDRYIRINILGVEKLIDALGGVTLYVPHDMHYKDDTQHLYIDVKQGKQHLNGAMAVQFLRFRYDAYGDIGRVQRQQLFIRALIEQTLKPTTIAKLPQILSVIQANIDTNLSIEELIALAGFAAQTDRSKTQMLLLPGEFSTPAQYTASYWLPNQPQIAAMVSQYFGVSSPDFANQATEVAAPAPHIAIQDSTGQQDAVQKLTDTLNTAGYNNVFVDQTWDDPLATTQIIAQQGDLKSAEAVQHALGYGEVRVEGTGNLQSDVTIRLGQDSLHPAAPAPTLSSTSPSAPAPASPSASPSASPPDVPATPQ